MGHSNVLIVSHFFPPEELGGAHRWKKLLKELPEEYDCRVVCPPPAFPYGEFSRQYRPIQRETIDGVQVTRLWTHQPRTDTKANGSSLGRILNYVVFSIFAALYVIANFWRYDHIVTVSAPHTTFLPGYIGKHLGLYWVVDVFDLWLDNAVDLGYTEKGSLGYRYIRTLERLAMTQSDHVTVITPTMETAFREKYDLSPDRFSIVPFGVDETVFVPTLGEQDSTEIIYIGNMGDAHALGPFVQAIELLDEEYTLALVGTGKRREELEETVSRLGLEDRVTFVGVVPRTEVASRLSRAAVSVVPLKLGHHLDYARPNKLLESMAVGTPFVGSAVREIVNVCEESGAGIAVQNEPSEISTALKTILTDPEKQGRMGHAGIEYIDTNHRWPILADRIADVLRSIEN